MALKDWMPATVQATGAERVLAAGQALFRFVLRGVGGDTACHAANAGIKNNTALSI